jgi:hypothetical protein
MLFKMQKIQPSVKAEPKFDDRTDMYHYEGQLNLTQHVKFAETLVGASFRQFRLNSHGSIFADTAGVIPINESVRMSVAALVDQ